MVDSAVGHIGDVQKAVESAQVDADVVVRLEMFDGAQACIFQAGVAVVAAIGTSHRVGVAHHNATSASEMNPANVQLLRPTPLRAETDRRAVDAVGNGGWSVRTIGEAPLSARLSSSMQEC